MRRGKEIATRILLQQNFQPSSSDEEDFDDDDISFERPVKRRKAEKGRNLQGHPRQKESESQTRTRGKRSAEDAARRIQQPYVGLNAGKVISERQENPIAENPKYNNTEAVDEQSSPIFSDLPVQTINNLFAEFLENVNFSSSISISDCTCKVWIEGVRSLCEELSSSTIGSCREERLQTTRSSPSHTLFTIGHFEEEVSTSRISYGIKFVFLCLRCRSDCK
jgi:hypothetical protein